MQFLVIARVTEGTPLEKLFPLVGPEAAKVWEFYKADRLRSVYYFADMGGAVLIYEGGDPDEVEEAMAQLPMVQAGALSIEIIPLKPYSGFEALFAK